MPKIVTTCVKPIFVHSLCNVYSGSNTFDYCLIRVLTWTKTLVVTMFFFLRFTLFKCINGIEWNGLWWDETETTRKRITRSKRKTKKYGVFDHLWKIWLWACVLPYCSIFLSCIVPIVFGHYCVPFVCCPFSFSLAILYDILFTSFAFGGCVRVYLSIHISVCWRLEPKS